MKIASKLVWIVGVLWGFAFLGEISTATENAHPLGGVVHVYLGDNIPDNWPLTTSDHDPFYELLANAKQYDPAIRLPAAGSIGLALPLFNSPATQRGRVSHFIGTASRIQRIEIDDPAIRAKLKADHYFQVDFVTPDSQGNPLVACVAELPPGMSVSGDCREPIELTAIFFKLWQYPIPLGDDEWASPSQHQIALQSAPLLIGHSFTRLKPPREAEKSGSIAFLGLLVLGTLGLAMLLWGIGQMDRDFFERCVLGRYKFNDSVTT